MIKYTNLDYSVVEHCLRFAEQHDHLGKKKKREKKLHRQLVKLILN